MLNSLVRLWRRFGAWMKHRPASTDQPAVSQPYLLQISTLVIARIAQAGRTDLAIVGRLRTAPRMGTCYGYCPISGRDRDSPCSKLGLIQPIHSDRRRSCGVVAR